MNPATKRHLELQIKILQNAPRDPDKLERLLKVKRRQKEEAIEREDTERLVTEIEMLKVVLYLVCRDNNNNSNSKELQYLLQYLIYHRFQEERRERGSREETCPWQLEMLSSLLVPPLSLLPMFSMSLRSFQQNSGILWNEKLYYLFIFLYKKSILLCVI